MKSFIQLVLLVIILFSFARSAEAVKKQKPTVPQEIFMNMGNTLIFDNRIDAVSVTTFMSAMVGKRIMLPAEETLYIVIVSGGGEATAAELLANAVHEIPNTKVICKYCASGAGLVYATAGKGKRLAIAKSEMIMHEMYLSHVTAKMMLNASLVLRLVNASDGFNKAIYSVIGMSREEYEDRIQDTEWTVRGADLIKFNLADQMVKPTCDEMVRHLIPDTCFE
jgi:ATP-dependent protease ClpP protease subunit